MPTISGSVLEHLSQFKPMSTFQNRPMNGTSNQFEQQQTFEQISPRIPANHRTNTNDSSSEPFTNQQDLFQDTNRFDELIKQLNQRHNQQAGLMQNYHHQADPTSWNLGRYQPSVAPDRRLPGIMAGDGGELHMSSWFTADNHTLDEAGLSALRQGQNSQDRQTEAPKTIESSQATVIGNQSSATSSFVVHYDDDDDDEDANHIAGSTRGTRRDKADPQVSPIVKQQSIESKSTDLNLLANKHTKQEREENLQSSYAGSDSIASQPLPAVADSSSMGNAQRALEENLILQSNLVDLLKKVKAAAAAPNVTNHVSVKHHPKQNRPHTNYRTLHQSDQLMRGLVPRHRVEPRPSQSSNIKFSYQLPNTPDQQSSGSKEHGAQANTHEIPSPIPVSGEEKASSNQQGPVTRLADDSSLMAAAISTNISGRRQTVDGTQPAQSKVEPLNELINYYSRQKLVNPTYEDADSLDDWRNSLINNNADPIHSRFNPLNDQHRATSSADYLALSSLIDSSGGVSGAEGALAGMSHLTGVSGSVNENSDDSDDSNDINLLDLSWRKVAGHQSPPDTTYLWAQQQPHMNNGLGNDDSSSASRLPGNQQQQGHSQLEAHHRILVQNMKRARQRIPQLRQKQQDQPLAVYPTAASLSSLVPFVTSDEQSATAGPAVFKGAHSISDLINESNPRGALAKQANAIKSRELLARQQQHHHQQQQHLNLLRNGGRLSLGKLATATLSASTMEPYALLPSKFELANGGEQFGRAGPSHYAASDHYGSAMSPSHQVVHIHNSPHSKDKKWHGKYLWPIVGGGLTMLMGFLIISNMLLSIPLLAIGASTLFNQGGFHQQQLVPVYNLSQLITTRSPSGRRRRRRRKRYALDNPRMINVTFASKSALDRLAKLPDIGSLFNEAFNDFYRNQSPDQNNNQNITANATSTTSPRKLPTSWAGVSGGVGTQSANLGRRHNRDYSPPKSADYPLLTSTKTTRISRAAKFGNKKVNNIDNGDGTSKAASAAGAADDPPPPTPARDQSTSQHNLVSSRRHGSLRMQHEPDGRLESNRQLLDKVERYIDKLVASLTSSLSGSSPLESSSSHSRSSLSSRLFGGWPLFSSQWRRQVLRAAYCHGATRLRIRQQAAHQAANVAAVANSNLLLG